MNINYFAPINQLSYGLTSLNILVELTRLGHNIALVPIGRVEAEPQYHDLIKKAYEQGQSSFFYNAPCLKIFHQNQMATMVGNGPKVGFPIFELEDFTGEEKHHLSYLDKIVVTSKWAKDVVERNIPGKKVYIAPLGVDTSVFYPVKQSNKFEKFVLLNVGKWEKRKGHDVLIEAFVKAFPTETDVELWMMPNGGIVDEQNRIEWESLYSSDKRVKILPGVETQHQLATIMNVADIGIFPSRAEGWNLPLLEMIACGKRVIATECTAHTEFLNDDNSWLIPHSNEYEEAWDGIWFKGQGKWMKWTEEQTLKTIKLLQGAYQWWKMHGYMQVNNSGIDTAKQFSWKNTVEYIVKALES